MPVLRLVAICWVLGLFGDHVLSGQQLAPGRLSIATYSAKTYGASPLNLAIAQDRRGLMYFGNSDGVLEYDGVTWRRIAVENGAAMTVASDSDGTIYVGGDGAFGYLRPDATGALQFSSLSELVGAQDKKFGITLSILPSPEGTYFLSSRRLFLVRANKVVKAWSTSGTFRRLLFRASHHVYLADSTTGLMEVGDRGLIPCPWGSAFKEDAPLSAQISSQGIIVASRNHLYRFAVGVVEKIFTASDAYLLENQIAALTRLSNGDLLVGTRAGGIIIYDTEWHIRRILDKSSGLPSDSVTALEQNREGVLWIATKGGLASFLPALSLFSQAEGLNGSVYSLAQSSGSLYAGSNAGLYRLADLPSGNRRFQPVPGIQSGTTVWSIERSENTTLVGTDTGVYRVDGNGAVPVYRSQAIYDLHYSRRNPGTVLAAGRDGLLVIRRIGSDWHLEAQERGNGQDIRTVAEDVDGRIWATTRVDVWRFDFRQSPSKVEHFDRQHGLPDGWRNVYFLRNHVVFATEKGLMRYSERAARFVPDDEFGSQFSDGSMPVFLLAEDPEHHIWISGKGYHGDLRILPSGEKKWNAMPLLSAGIEDIWALYVENDGVIWASGSEGSLFRWDPKLSNSHGTDFRVMIRSVSAAQSTKPFYGGDGPMPSELKIPYAQNAIRFEFVSPFFEEANAVRYQFKLDGSDRKWSQWTTESHKDFTNLPPRHLIFRVRAQSPHGEESPEVAFPFRVLPPWYRTWWAYVLYIVGLSTLARFVFRWRLAVLRAHNRQLEKIVEVRTTEVRAQRDQNEALLLNILPAPVALELRDRGTVAPMTFENVTVCFTDFVGFTLSSERLPASQLVTALNDYFTAFDGIMDRYGLEKLKTIGDAYMFASGLPEPRPSHAVDAVLAALEIVHAAQTLARRAQSVNWKMRVGLYSGPVVAGVVGKNKFAFDIWGSTVNLASRMEASGGPGRVNVSESTWLQIRGLMECEPRGFVRTKEGRELEMFFVIRPKPELMDSAVESGVPVAFREKYRAMYSYPPRSFPEYLLEAQPINRE